MTTRFIVGIDLGTTHSVLAFAPREAPDQIEVFKISQRVGRSEIESRDVLASTLYAPVSSEFGEHDTQDELGEKEKRPERFIVGEFARVRAAEVPARAITSSKSWLCHRGIDPRAAILPWAATDTEMPRLSPVDAATAILVHIRRAWDASGRGPLADQEIALTVPASFDEVSRELTVEAATRAGLRVRLLEEPQAAFHDYLARRGERGLDAIFERQVVAQTDATRRHARAGEPRGDSAFVLVCDIGGGTTDLSLMRIERGSPPRVERVAVGNHILLGGDNMDLALALRAEERLGEKLDPPRFAALVLACRLAKEKLLAGGNVESVPIAIALAGSAVVGRTLRTELRRDEVRSIVLDGFFPEVPRDAKPSRVRGGLLAFGLPYEREVAITRHIAAFIAAHLNETQRIDAVLFNGGVFHSSEVRDRLSRAIAAWSDAPPIALDHRDPDLAVARGAVAHLAATLGRGIRIGGGSSRGYYIEVGGAERSRLGVCVVPRGADEAVSHTVPERIFSLTIGRPVRFSLFTSPTRSDSAGAIVPIDDNDFFELPPLTAAVTAASKKEQDVRVYLQGELTAIGTLELACVEANAPASIAPRRFRLAFQVRPRDAAVDETHSTVSPSTRPSGPHSIGGRRATEAKSIIDLAFAKEATSERPIKDLLRDLERLLGERASWSGDTNRAIFDAISPHVRTRRASADHERVFWMIAGYTLRPGYGDAADPSRVRKIAFAIPERVTHAEQPRVWQQFFIAIRRIAGGLDESTQSGIREGYDPFIAPSEAKLKKPKKTKPLALEELLDAVASLERIDPAARSDLGSWLLERTWTERDPRLWAALGKIGARMPTYASVHHVVAPFVAERWLEQLLREKWETLPTAPLAAAQLARTTGDRARDVSDPMRSEVIKRLQKVGARAEWIRAVSELVDVDERDRAEFFGDGLPVGLSLV